MAVTYSGTLKTNRMQLVADLIASKTAVASSGAGSLGSLVIGTSSLSGATGVIATFALQNPAATVSGSVLTLAGTPLSNSTPTAGTAALAELRNNAGTVIVGGLTVGTSAADIILNSLVISTGETVTITSGTITHG
jgi:hypothetical protein